MLSVAVFAPSNASAQSTEDIAYFDSVEVSLLTCQPHDEVYSLYGHTALRWHDLHKENADIAFNWGVFDYGAPYFVIRFVFGLTDYELGGYPYELFKEEYRQYGSMVNEQVLNLTSEEKLQLRKALSENLLPENRIYRYNYFYNNCTTKARDIIEQCVNGKIEYAERQDYTPSYRQTIHEMTIHNPWSRFGNDLLLGVKADQPTTLRQQEFLPQNLQYDFDRAQIYKDGQYRPLVKERRVAVAAGVQIVDRAFPLSPKECALVLAVWGILLFCLEFKKRIAFLWWDVVLMIVTAIIGTVLFLMLFSQHPTVSLNLHILLFNPLPWFYLWSVIRKKKTHYWAITSVLAILFLLGSIWQHYAEGIHVLALFLLMQSYIHQKRVIKE